MGWFVSGASEQERTSGAIMHGQAQMDFRKPIKENHDFQPSWQARSGTHSWQDTEDEGIARLEPRHESAKTTFHWHLLARDLLPNQLRYKQLRMNLLVKMVEKLTVNRRRGRERTIRAIMHGQARMNFRKPIKESNDFRPSWQA